MKSITEKTELVNALLPFLNEMAQQEKTQIVASTNEPITFSELMKLSDQELEALEKLMQKAKAGKKTQENVKRYESTMKPDYTLTHSTAEKLYTIK